MIEEPPEGYEVIEFESGKKVLVEKADHGNATGASLQKKKE